MSVSELTEWAVVTGMWADDEKAAIAKERDEAAAGRGGGAPSKGNYPHGIGPNKGLYVNTREEAIELGLMDAPVEA